MSTFDYAKSAITALTLITKFGQTVTVNRVAGTYTAATGAIGSSSSSSYTPVVVTVPASGGTVQAFDDRLKEAYITGKLRFFIMAAKDLAVVPQSGDRIEFEGTEWEIEGATPLNPAGTPVIYNIGCKEGGATT
jgi:hypothetical protein